MASTLDDLDKWLGMIEEHTRESRRLLDAIASGRSPSGGPAPPPPNAPSAFDRPQPVVVMGPRPLPVDAVGGGGGGSKPPKPADDAASRFERAMDMAARSAEQMYHAISGSVRGLNQRGMSGTLEQAQFDYAREQLSRQVAAVFLPVTQAMTYFMSRLETQMRGMSGAEQNRLLGAGLGGYAGYRLGGPLGAAGGMLAGSALAGGGTDRDLASLGLGAALIGGRLGGAHAAIPGAAAAYHFGSRYAADNVSTGSRYGDLALRSGLDALNPLGPAGAAALDFAVPRAGGLAAAGLGARGAERRDVTPFNPVMMEAGGTAERIQQGIIRATAGDGYEEDGGPLAPIANALLEITALLRELVGVVGGNTAPAARSARE
jgi:hypothetical protein